MAEWSVRGVDEVIGALSALPAKFQASTIRTVLKKIATREVLKPLKSALPYSEKTKKEIRVGNNPKNKTGITIGPTAKVPWVRWIEKGTVPRTTSSGAYRGQIRGRKRIEPFVDSKIPNVIKALNEEFGKEVNELLKKKLSRIKKSN